MDTWFCKNTHGILAGSFRGYVFRKVSLLLRVVAPLFWLVCPSTSYAHLPLRRTEEQLLARALFSFLLWFFFRGYRFLVRRTRTTFATWDTVVTVKRRFPLQRRRCLRCVASRERRLPSTIAWGVLLRPAICGW
jgi:hypothetical protein